MKFHILLLNILLFSFLACSSPYQNNVTFENERIELLEIDTSWQDKIIKPNSYWKKKLTKTQYSILREKDTEAPFNHAYNSNKKAGLYLCAGCDNPLFTSSTKFNSGTGWPSFWDPYFGKSVLIGADNSLGMSRDEVVCARCNGHLGHVFSDGPKPTGLRYCMNGESLKFVGENNSERVVFAQGCFWCVEEIFEVLNGVDNVVSGYAGGTEENPSYKQVGSGSTSHAEAIEISYNPDKISYEELLKVYFNAGDITRVNGQGNDRGTQYRSILFYNNAEQKQQIDNYIKMLENSGKYNKKIAVEVLPASKFYIAEKYHQNYVKLNPNQDYVRSVSIPRYEKAIKNFPELLK